MQAANQADKRGDDVAIDQASAQSSRIPKDMPVEAYCRVYDCETFLEAFCVWAIALLHVRKGVVDNVDLSRFICDLFGWPHPADDGRIDAGVDTIVER